VISWGGRGLWSDGFDEGGWFLIDVDAVEVADFHAGAVRFQGWVLCCWLVCARNVRAIAGDKLSGP
jgi:hypothetical protein